MKIRGEFGQHVLANTLGSLAAAGIIYLLAVLLGYVTKVDWVVVGGSVGLVLFAAVVTVEFVNNLYRDIVKGLQASQAFRTAWRNRRRRP